MSTELFDEDTSADVTIIKKKKQRKIVNGYLLGRTVGKGEHYEYRPYLELFSRLNLLCENAIMRIIRYNAGYLCC
jgi:hypothetical protein